MVRIEQFSKTILANFFLIVLLSRLCEIAGLFNTFRLFQLSGLMLGVYFARTIKVKGFDILIFFYLVYIIFNSLLTNYTHHLQFLYTAFWAQIIPIFFYFIGRGTTFCSAEVFSKMRWPLLFAVVVGFYCFFMNPSWYWQMKMDLVDSNTSSMGMSEIFRLSSFWGHPYQLGYAIVLYLCWFYYYFLNNSYSKSRNLMYIMYVFVFLVCLLLAQLRVTIFFSIIAFLYVLFMLKRKNLMKIMPFIICICFVVAIALLAILNNLDSTVSDYISQHLLMLGDEDSYSDRFEHTAGGVVDYSMLGDGFGRYGFGAREHGNWALVDNEYQRQIAELGYFGIIILVIILLLTFFKSFFKKSCITETLVFLFFLTAMIGASVLSNEHQYNYVFWFCVGRIWNSAYRKSIVYG